MRAYVTTQRAPFFAVDKEAVFEFDQPVYCEENTVINMLPKPSLASASFCFMLNRALGLDPSKLDVLNRLMCCALSPA